MYTQFFEIITENGHQIEGVVNIAGMMVSIVGIYKSRLKVIDHNIERQKTRLKKEEIPYELYLEFVTDFEKEKKEIQKELTPGGQGVSNPELCVEFAVTYSTKLAPCGILRVTRINKGFNFCSFRKEFSIIEWKTGVDPLA